MGGKEAGAALPHGPLCQCVACRAERFARRGHAAQQAVDAEIRKVAKQPKRPPPKSHARVKR